MKKTEVCSNTLVYISTKKKKEYTIKSKNNTYFMPSIFIFICIRSIKFYGF